MERVHNVTPRASHVYSMNDALMDPKLAGDVDLTHAGREPLFYLERLERSELGGALPLATDRSPMPITVGHVFLRGTPAEIVQPVVRWVAVEMPTLESGPSWAHEGGQYECVNAHLENLVLTRQPDVAVAHPFHSDRVQGSRRQRSQASPWTAEGDDSGQASDLSVVAHLIETFPARDWKPTFHAHNISAYGAL